MNFHARWPEIRLNEEGGGAVLICEIARDFQRIETFTLVHARAMERMTLRRSKPIVPALLLLVNPQIGVPLLTQQNEDVGNQPWR